MIRVKGKIDNDLFYGKSIKQGKDRIKAENRTKGKGTKGVF